MQYSKLRGDEITSTSPILRQLSHSPSWLFGSIVFHSTQEHALSAASVFVHVVTLFGIARLSLFLAQSPGVGCPFSCAIYPCRSPLPEVGTEHGKYMSHIFIPSCLPYKKRLISLDSLLPSIHAANPDDIKESPCNIFVGSRKARYNVCLPILPYATRKATLPLEQSSSPCYFSNRSSHSRHLTILCPCHQPITHH